MDSFTTVETKHFGVIPARHRDCPLCGCDNCDVAPSSYSHGPWIIKHCPNCRFVYIDHAPQYEVQFEAMAWDRTTKVEEQRRAEMRPFSYKVSKRTRFRMRILPKRTMPSYISARAGGERPGSRVRRRPSDGESPTLLHTVRYRNLLRGRSSG